MKKFFIAALVASSFATVSLPSFAASSLKATVNGMVCAFCAQGIEKRLTGMQATKTVWVDLKKKTVAVEAKDGQALDEKAVAAEITEAGYEVVKMERVAQSVAEIKAELKARK